MITSQMSGSQDDGCGMVWKTGARRSGQSQAGLGNECLTDVYARTLEGNH